MNATADCPTLDALGAGLIDAADFGHDAHLRVAFEAVNAHEFFDALARVAHGLRALAESAGVPEKFNATVTLAFVSLVAERARTGGYTDFDAFLSANADLRGNAILNGYFSAPRLATALAREVALMPDTVPEGRG
jgi:hypothetical protein